MFRGYDLAVSLIIFILAIALAVAGVVNSYNFILKTEKQCINDALADAIAKSVATALSEGTLSAGDIITNNITAIDVTADTSATSLETGLPRPIELNITTGYYAEVLIYGLEQGTPADTPRLVLLHKLVIGTTRNEPPVPVTQASTVAVTPEGYIAVVKVVTYGA